MKIGILSDIHANLHALNAVFEDAARRGVEQFLCLGDVVGYGPCPEACVEKLRELEIPTVLGNHDAWARRGVDFGAAPTAPSTIPGIDLARRQLGIASLSWLRKLPLIIKTYTHAITHASYHALGSWDCICDTESARLSFEKLPGQLGFFGHTHEAGLWVSGKMPRWFQPQCGRPYKLKPDTRYLINPGSVGNPRSSNDKSDNRAQYLIFDTSIRRITLHRVPYDEQAYIDALREAGLAGGKVDSEF
ncbi:putative phosphodiesterase [Ereboglobus sp. PH5-5]|uniref:metallophosphoesterase family protein n=1 Tax=Ereboglobus sp. PH5-5 TaxID=2940529 RepID=UPI002407082A|nr:metallophosphoesterase family protein [Ereboglobus sp. PH5-5]MDF9833402.1 putative phosphodiesterase [Ereboglobus sp. PH5-5]